MATLASICVSGPAFLRAGWRLSRASLQVSSGDSRLTLPVGHSGVVLTRSESAGWRDSWASESWLHWQRSREHSEAKAALRMLRCRQRASTSMGYLAPAHPAPLVGWPPLPLVIGYFRLRIMQHAPKYKSDT
jgi:hypothetical protein